MKNLVRAIFAATIVVLLAAGSAVPSNAARHDLRYRSTRAYDGLWSVSVVTLRGDCSRSYRYPLRIFNGRVLKADEDPNYQVYGAVAPGGWIVVTVARTSQTASGRGRLSRNYGRGWWRTASGECSGEWTAVRR
jgi:hypothetical protein